MNMRFGTAGFLGLCLSCQLIAGAALGGCAVRGGIDVTPPSLTVGTSSESSETGWTKVGSATGLSGSGNKYHIATTGYQPTTDIEDIALKNGIKFVTKELDTMKDRCGFTIPVELMYAVPMKAWTGAEGWGSRRGCTNRAETGGCSSLAMCSEIIKMFWFDLCGYSQEGVKRAYRGWNTKITKVVCRGEAAPPETSAMDNVFSRSKAVLSRDGTVTVTLHPSDANISTDFAEWLRPRVEAE